MHERGSFVLRGYPCRFVDCGVIRGAQQMLGHRLQIRFFSS